MSARRRTADSRYMGLLACISEMIASGKDVDTILSHTVRLIQSLLGVKRCSILIMDTRTGYLTVRAAAGMPRRLWSAIKIRPGHGIAGKVLSRRKPVLVKNRRELLELTKQPSRRYTTHSFISIPLLPIHGKRHAPGVINVANKVTREAFTSHDLDLLQAIAGLLSLLLENTRLFALSENTKKRLADMIENLDVGIVTINGDHVVTHCNQKAASLLGCTSVRARQKPLSRLMGKKTATVLGSLITKSIRTKGQQEIELDLLAGSAGSPIPVRVTMVPLTSAPLKPRESMMIFTDLSLRREIAELKHIDQLKSNFMSMVSHELRTPLTSITGALHLLKENLPLHLSSTQEQLFHIIHNNTNRLTTLVNNLLDVTHIENHTFAIQRIPTNLHEMVDAAVEPFREVTQKKGIKLTVRHATFIPLLSLDEKRIRQVIHNLLDNAVKFTPSNGRISVQTSNDDNKVTIRVKDTGIGIDSSHKEKIFQKFYQVDNSISRQWGGAGLGLYIAKAVITMHKGDIELVDSSKQGTEFLITLPLKP